MRKIIFISFLFCFTGLQAQHIKPFFNTLSVENGLPEGYVVSSLQDKLGYIWLGTQNGLVRYDGYKLKSYSFPDENGLPVIYCSIRQLHEDKTGKLWALVGKNGLYYLDRQKDAFIKVKLDASDAEIFTDHIIIKWVEDQISDTHWFLAYNAVNQEPCVYTFDKLQNKFEKYSPQGKDENYLPSYKYADIIKDIEGKIWVVADSLLSFFDPPSNSFKPWFVLPESTKNVMISGVTDDPENKDLLWITIEIPKNVTTNKSPTTEFFQINTKTKGYKSFKNDENDPTSIAGNCIAIINDSFNRTWFITENGISLFNRKLETFYNYSLSFPKASFGNEAHISVIASDKDGNLWMAGNFNGLFYLDVKTAHTTFYAHSKTPGSLPDSPRGINKLFYDRSGTFWVSLPWRGIAYLDQQKTMLNPIPIEPTSDKPNGVISQDDFYVSGRYNDSVFFVNNNSGLFQWNYKRNSFNRIELNNNNVYSQIRTVFAAKDGLIWIGSSQAGLFSYDPLKKSVKNFTNDPKDSTTISTNSITEIAEDHDGNLWIGTNGQGLCRFNKKTSVFTRFPFLNNNGTIQANNVLDDNRVLFLYVDNEGILWIGTNQGALNRLDTKAEKFTSYLDQNAGFSCVVNIFEDSQQRMWNGTYLSGLFLVDKETGSKKRYSEQDGLLFNSVFGIEEDNDGNIWTASSRGLSRLNPESNRISNFYVPTGDLRSNDILFKGTDGSLQVSIVNGLISFDPEKMNASMDPPSTVIESVGYRTTDNKDTTIFTYGRTQIELKYNENKISFQYVALHFANSELNQYAYKLEGYDEEWIQAGAQRSATYTNLSPGKYLFKVVAANSDEVWNENGPSFSIRISPPWWQSTFAYIFYVLIFIAGVIAVDRVQRKRLREKANRQVKEKELAQAREIEKAYKKLKTTQSQLVHAEKMASLGELTAGIAHEIQNPLNFVKNFSEVNTELIEELKEEVDKGNMKEVKSIADDIAKNEKKIVHHGGRADAIVKNMLQHSRGSGEEKQLTDINGLADEYLRLSYHGLRAKDKAFNADFKTDFDKTLPMIKVIPQDIGRVILNLVNNAFHAVSQKTKQNQLEFVPNVVVTTTKSEHKVEIRIQDNGDGIPIMILDKIFQPFFTTKSAGEGTGLGLSLSYDIITKGHGGELKVETKEGEGTAFIVVLPLSE